MSLPTRGVRVPEADLRVSSLARDPFADDSSDVGVTNDVLQHVHEDEVARSVGELARVLAPNGTLLVRTNGGRRSRRARADWRVYDRRGLRATLERAGLRCERVTHANLVLSLIAVARGRAPKPPTEERHRGFRRRRRRSRQQSGARSSASKPRWSRGRRCPFPTRSRCFCRSAVGLTPSSRSNRRRT